MNLSSSRFVALSTVTLALASVLMFGFATPAHAATHSISGWAWSSTIGWIDMNCADQGVCGSSNYAVTIDDKGNFGGRAWSPSIGWIKFGGLSSFPGAGSNAVVSTSSGLVSGWIRACSGTQTGDCSTMTSRTDGWDGWIELSGTNHTSPNLSGTGGVTYDKSTRIFRGYAWGGDAGWISFAPTIPGQPVPPALNNYSIVCGDITDNCTGQSGGSQTITGTCSASPTATALTTPTGPAYSSLIMQTLGPGALTGYNGSVTYYWKSQGWTSAWRPGMGDPSSSNSSNSVQYSAVGTYDTGVYVVDSDGNWGSISCGSVNVSPYNPPSAGINLMIGYNTQIVSQYLATDGSAGSHNLIVHSGQSFVLRDINSLSPSSNYACNAVITGPTNPAAWQGYGSSFGDTTVTYSTVGVPTGTYTLSQQCTDTGSGTVYTTLPIVTLKVIVASLEPF